VSEDLLLSYQRRATDVTQRYVAEKGLGEEVESELLSALGLDETPSGQRVITSLSGAPDNGA
jgi:hypothetical protein